MEKCRTNPPLIEKLLLRKAHDSHIPRQAHTSLPYPYPPYTIQISADTPMHLILPAGFPESRPHGRLRIALDFYKTYCTSRKVKRKTNGQPKDIIPTTCSETQTTPSEAPRQYTDTHNSRNLQQKNPQKRSSNHM